VCLVVPRAVTTPSAIALYASFAPALLSSAWMFACLLACLLDDLTIILLDDCEEFEIFTYTIFQNCIVFQHLYRSPISVLFSCICTDLHYRYCFRVSYYSIVISIVLIA